MGVIKVNFRDVIRVHPTPAALILDHVYRHHFPSEPHPNLANLCRAVAAPIAEGEILKALYAAQGGPDLYLELRQACTDLGRSGQPLDGMIGKIFAEARDWREGFRSSAPEDILEPFDTADGPLAPDDPKRQGLALLFDIERPREQASWEMVRRSIFHYLDHARPVPLHYRAVVLLRGDLDENPRQEFLHPLHAEVLGRRPSVLELVSFRCDILTPRNRINYTIDRDSPSVTFKHPKVMSTINPEMRGTPTPVPFRRLRPRTPVAAVAPKPPAAQPPPPRPKLAPPARAPESAPPPPPPAVPPQPEIAGGDFSLSPASRLVDLRATVEAALLATKGHEVTAPLVFDLNVSLTDRRAYAVTFALLTALPRDTLGERAIVPITFRFPDGAEIHYQLFGGKQMVRKSIVQPDNTPWEILELSGIYLLCLNKDKGRKEPWVQIDRLHLAVPSIEHLSDILKRAIALLSQRNDISNIQFALSEELLDRRQRHSLFLTNLLERLDDETRDYTGVLSFAVLTPAKSQSDTPKIGIFVFRRTEPQDGSRGSFQWDPGKSHEPNQLLAPPPSLVAPPRHPAGLEADIANLTLEELAALDDNHLFGLRERPAAPHTQEPS